MTTWIDTLEARRALAAEPKTLEELNRRPAVQPALNQPGMSKADVADLVAKEVSTQMDTFMTRLEWLFQPPAATPAANTPAEAPSSPAPAVTAPVQTDTAQTAPAGPEAAQGVEQPA